MIHGKSFKQGFLENVWVIIIVKLVFVQGIECLPNLKNLAVYEGEENILMNLTADPRIVKWTGIPTSDEFGTYIIQDKNGTRDSSLTGLFYPNQSGLVILRATTSPDSGGTISTSGLYIAQCPVNGNQYGAKLLVVRECFK